MAFGKVITGNVLDCKRAPIERWLRNYDAQLYLEWNPAKLEGKGCWEVWRRPSKQTAVYEGTLSTGEAIYRVDYVRNKLTHHVLDAAVLDWRIPAKIQAMDTFGKHDWVATMEYEGLKRLAAKEHANREEMKYMVRQEASTLRAWAQRVAAGENPGRVLNRFKPTM